MQVGFKTDKGKVRDTNEDAFLAEPPIYAVADGMGGLSAGEHASRIAIDALRANKNKLIHSKNPLAALEFVFKKTNEKISQFAKGSSLGMGTTLTAVLLKGKKAYIGHIGDCRLYMINSERIAQITEDHSLVQELVSKGVITSDEAKTHPNRNVITKSLGITKELEPDLFEIDLKPEEQLLILSDGATSMLSEEELKTIVLNNTAKKACMKIIDVANERGGYDNATAVLVADIFGGRKNTKTANAAIIVMELAIALFVSVGILLFYLANQFFIKLDGDSIALHQGHPVKVFGVSFSRKLIEKSVQLNDTPNWYIRKLEDGVGIESYDDGIKAIDYVESYSFTND